MFDLENWRVDRALILALALGAGCGRELSSAPRQEMTSSTQDLTGPNGLDWNGLDWNGLDWNGASFLGVSVNNVRLYGDDISNVHLDGTVLQGTNPLGSQLSGCDFVGAHLRGVLSDSSVAHLRIDDYGASDDPEISLYAVSYWSPVDLIWKPLCGTDGGVPIKATALAGRWNYSQGVAGGGSYISDASAFTFACDHSVLYKCTDWGYKPWKSVALANLHQACTRMVRADYCGDGTPNTVNGTAINYFDWEGIAIDDAPADWIGDAEWIASGAACIANLRHPELATPPCFTQLQRSSCVDASDFGQDATLLMNKIQPP